ncbi:hypothetical protein SBRCBS47491_009538 [Sporothrix bragantina]|uniref:Prefoldin subunit n=1 Tax=Sporothrix bragantina TaxID=671064 RepID=A0ABP0CX58_9PEZI
MMAQRIALLAGTTRHSLGAPSIGLHREWPSRTTTNTTTTACTVRCVATASRTAVRTGTHERTGYFRKPTRRQARRFRRFKFLTDSPNATLALRLKSRSMALTFEAWKRFDDVARSQSMRLPVVALQMMLRHDEAQRPTSLSDSLCDPETWRMRLNSLAFKGITENDIQHWLWVLSAQDSDERIARFVADEARPKPVFMLFQLLRRDETFHKGRSLTGLYNYIARHHVNSRMRLSASELPFGAVRRAVDPALNMAPDTFATLLRLLVHHYIRLWPSALPAVARLVVSYVETLPHMVKRGEQQAFADACRIFNYALVLFQRKSPVSPVFQMRYNWRAQKVLLAMSTTLPRPLFINRAGFRAIRRVLLALGKSPAERNVALRMARTWPPYRRNWDGRDEQRQAQDDFSRSAQAGVLMREAGYAEVEHDRALGVLGGVLPGESPTVQTRSLSPRTWTGFRASLNVFSTWAARVKATRDVNEAWHEFQTAPGNMDGDGRPLRPSIQVYAEMFKKLVAMPVEFYTAAGSSSSQGQAVGRHGKELLPGDAKEVYPVNDATLTAFEKQRLRPPTVAVLYAQMLHDDIRPVGDCLSVLLQNAPTLEAAMKYLHDSPLDKAAIAALKLPRASHISPPPDSNTNTHAHSSPFSSTRQSSRRFKRQQPLEPERPITLELLRNIPLPILNAYIFLMCRFQPRLTAEAARLGKQRRTALIHHAIQLSARRLPPSIEEGRTYKATWHTIMRTLAQPKLMVSPQNTNDRRFHDTESLYLALRVFDQVSQAGGVDVILFDSLCKVMQKSLRWTDPTLVMAPATDPVEDTDEGQIPASQSTTPPPAVNQRESELLQTAHASLVAAFEEMTILSSFETDLTGSPDSSTPPLAPHHPATPHNITAGMLQAYLQTLGYLGDTEAMTRAMHWVLRTWDDWTVLEDAKNPDDGQHATMGRVLIMYRAFVEGLEATPDPTTSPVNGEDVVPGSQVASVKDHLTQLQRRGCMWHWPSSYDADQYVRWHRKEHNEEFWARVRPSALLA